MQPGSGAPDLETAGAAAPPARSPIRRGLLRAILAAALLIAVGALVEEPSMLTAGTRAPDFELTDASGRTVRLADFSGKPLILFFYPSDFTPT